MKGFVYMYMYIPFSVPFNIYTHEFFSQRSATHTALLPRFAPTVSACILTPYLDKNTPSTYIHPDGHRPQAKHPQLVSLVCGACGGCAIYIIAVR